METLGSQSQKSNNANSIKVKVLSKFRLGHSNQNMIKSGKNSTKQLKTVN